MKPTINKNIKQHWKSYFGFNNALLLSLLNQTPNGSYQSLNVIIKWNVGKQNKTKP